MREARVRNCLNTCRTIDSSRRSINGLVITGGSDGATAVVDDSDGLVKLQPHTSAPHDRSRLYPVMLGAWQWLVQDGRLRKEFVDLSACGE